MHTLYYCLWKYQNFYVMFFNFIMSVNKNINWNNIILIRMNFYLNNLIYPHIIAWEQDKMLFNAESPNNCAKSELLPKEIVNCTASWMKIPVNSYFCIFVTFVKFHINVCCLLMISGGCLTNLTWTISVSKNMNRINNS